MAGSLFRLFNRSSSTNPRLIFRSFLPFSKDLTLGAKSSIHVIEWQKFSQRTCPELLQQSLWGHPSGGTCYSVSACLSEMPISEQPNVVPVVSNRIKFKRPDKTARHIMHILNREAVAEVRSCREIPDIRPGYIIQMKVEIPENKRRVSLLKGIVIARRNAGPNTTFRIRRVVAGVGVESVFPLYSPNIKEIKILDKKRVRRAKLYYLREQKNALRK